MAGFHKEFIATTYEFFEENGRVRVLYPKPDSALMEDAWMDPEDLLTFVYDCCDAECIPVKASLKRSEWNPCFKEGIGRVRSQLPAPHAAAPSGGGRSGFGRNCQNRDCGGRNEERAGFRRGIAVGSAADH